MPKEKVKPVTEFRLGCVKAVVWENPTPNNGKAYNVTVGRIYKDGNQWRDSSSFGRHDLPLLAKVVDMAYEWTFTQGRQQNGSQDGEQNGSSHEGF